MIKSGLNIRSVKHLCMRLRTSERELTSIMSDPSRFYRFREISKDGKIRIVARIYGPLRVIQDRLQDELRRLQYPVELQGGFRGRSNVSNANIHLRPAAILKSDISNFYPSVSNAKVYRVFCNVLGCSPAVSRILTRLCTLNGALPQGAPTSSILAGLASMNLLRRARKLAQTHRARFSLYVDDLTLSGPKHVTQLESLVCRMIEQSGFRPNRGKTYGVQVGEFVVTGVRIEKQIDCPSKKLREIDIEIDKVRTDNHSPRQVRSLEGKIRYVTGLNRGAANLRARRLRRRLRKLRQEPR